MCAFKSHLKEVYTQLAEIKEKYSDETTKFEREGKLQQLTQSLDWFKDESLRLNEYVLTLEKQTEKWKSKAITNEDEVRFLTN